MNRHKQQTRRKNQTEANLKKEMKGSYQMKKMKKACAVLLAVLSVSLLASAFAAEDNNNNNNTVRWQNILDNIPHSNTHPSTAPTRAGSVRMPRCSFWTFMTA